MIFQLICAYVISNEEECSFAIEPCIETLLQNDRTQLLFNTVCVLAFFLTDGVLLFRRVMIESILYVMCYVLFKQTA